MSTLSDMSLNYRSQYIKHSEISINFFGFALCSLESCFFCVRLSPAFLAAEWGLTIPHRTDGDLTKSEESDRTGISCEPRSSSLEFISSNNKGTPPLLFGSRRMISIDQDSSSNNSGDIEWISTRKPDTRSPMILKSGHWTIVVRLGIQSLPPRFILEVGASEQPDRFSFESPRLQHLSSYEATRKRALVNGSQHPLYHFHRFSFLGTVF